MWNLESHMLGRTQAEGSTLYGSDDGTWSSEVIIFVSNMFIVVINNDKGSF